MALVSVLTDIRLAYTFIAHLKLANELSKDPEKGLNVCGLAVLSKVRRCFGKVLHSALLEGLQRLDCWMAIFQEVLDTQESRHTKYHGLLYQLCFYFILCCVSDIFSVLCTSFCQAYSEGYAHDDSETVLSSSRHLLTG